MIPRPLREFAEAPDRFTTLSPGLERIVDDRFVLLLGPTWCSVSCVRTRDVERAVADVRAAAADRARTIWWIGPSTEPHDLEERLVGLGLARPHVPELVAMALARPPEPGPPGVDVRRVESFAEFRVAVDVRWEAFGIDAARRAEEEEKIEELWRAASDGTAVWFLAYADGRAAATALGVFAPRGCLLVSGATLPWARGRGLYRALVRARWDESVRRGAPGLAVAATPATSYPILRRLGFEDVCRVRRLEDAPVHPRPQLRPDVESRT